MTYKYGIDFGTTNSSIALRFVGDDKEEHTLVVDVKDTLPHETLPSVVLVDRTGSISVGEDAINKYTQSGIRNNDQLFIKRIKLDLENKGRRIAEMERQMERVPLTSGIRTISTRRGASSHFHNPFVILAALKKWSK